MQDGARPTFGVVGLGYVGLPLAVEAAKEGIRVIGFDVSEEVTEGVNAGRSHIQDVPGEHVRRFREAGLLEATTDMGRLSECDVVSICVPTPLSKTRDPDVSYVLAASQAVAAGLRKGQLILLESTTYPGTTREILLPALAETGLVVGEDFHLCFSPERVDPGNEEWTTKNTPKVVGGITPSCTEAAVRFYGRFLDTVVPVSSAEAAELTKILENTFRAVNIGLVNEIAIIADRLGVDVWEVIDAAATKPFGFMPFYPGPGLGGHCIPIDPFYLTWKAREYGVDTRFIELAGEINHAMPAWVVGKVEQALAAQGGALAGSRVLVLGIAYKKNVDDTRESPSVEIMQQLHDAGAEVAYCDPLVPAFPPMRRYRFELASEPFEAENLARFDCVVIGTDHDLFDWELLARHARAIVDARGVYRGRNGKVFAA